MLLDPKNFAGETTDMNWHLFQSIDKSKDATQYVKTVEALERYAFKTYSVDLSSLFRRENPSKPEFEVPRKPTKKGSWQKHLLSKTYIIWNLKSTLRLKGC